MSTEKSQNVQDVFLNHVRKNKTPVTVFLVNGVKLQGIITWFDNFCVLLRRDAHSQLVYKHAISTVMPAQPIQLFEGGKEAERALSRHRIAATTPSTRPCARRPSGDEIRRRGRSSEAPKRSLDARLDEAVGLAQRHRSRCRARRDRPRGAAGAGDLVRQRQCRDAARHHRRKRDRAGRRRRDADARCSSAISNGAGRPRSSTAPA